MQLFLDAPVREKGKGVLIAGTATAVLRRLVSCFITTDWIRAVPIEVGEHLQDHQRTGRFRVATLLNNAVTPPYMHDGRFSDLLAFLHMLTDPTFITNPEFSNPNLR
jgi:hypothetical protein